MNVKRKGNTGERELRQILDRYGEAIRNDQRYIGGLLNPDIAFSFKGKAYHVECKRTERLDLHGAIRQAEHDAAGQSIPCVIHRRNREPWYITLRLSDFLEVDTDATEAGEMGTAGTGGILSAV